MLRKDFMVTDYQLWEARAHGADLVLLIVAALTDPELAALLAPRRASSGMTALVEVHDEVETQRAVDAGATRHRRQRPQPQDPRHPPRDVLAPAPPHPRGLVTVAESGIAGPADAAAYAAQGADAVLVGEALVRTGDPRAGAAAMVAAGARPTRTDTP